MDLISVIMPCYNCEKTIDHAVSSLLKQTYKNWECIIVDDGSTDKTADRIRSITDPRFKTFFLNQNKGRGFARQKALESAQGSFICFLDADDWYLPKKLELQLSQFRKFPNVSVVSCAMGVADKENKLLGIQRSTSNNEQVYNLLNSPRFLPIPFAPSMIRSSIAHKSKFDPLLRQSEDFDFLLKILLTTSFCSIDYCGYIYREEESMSFFKITSRILQSAKIFKKYRRDFPLQTNINYISCILRVCYYFCIYTLGLKSWSVRRRLKSPSDADLAEFNLDIFN